MITTNEVLQLVQNLATELNVKTEAIDIKKVAIGEHITQIDSNVHKNNVDILNEGFIIYVNGVNEQNKPFFFTRFILSHIIVKPEMFKISLEHLFY